MYVHVLGIFNPIFYTQILKSQQLVRMYYIWLFTISHPILLTVLRVMVNTSLSIYCFVLLT